MKLIAFVLGIVVVMFLVGQRNARKREEARVARDAFVADSVRKAFVADSMRQAYITDSIQNAQAATYNRLRRPPTFRTGEPTFTGESDFRENEAAKVMQTLRTKEACLAREARMNPRPEVSRCD